uniref:F-box family protein n=1 Tax=Rhizophora mucronata TaxID=61149 RepID=A0A2P2J0H6_RHIMU
MLKKLWMRTKGC